MVGNISYENIDEMETEELKSLKEQLEREKEIITHRINRIESELTNRQQNQEVNKSTAYIYDYKGKVSEEWEKRVEFRDPCEKFDGFDEHKVCNVIKVSEEEQNGEILAWKFDVRNPHAYEFRTRVSLDDPTESWRDDHEIRNVTPLRKSSH